MKNSLILATLLSISTLPLASHAEDLIREDHVGEAAIVLGGADYARAMKLHEQSVNMKDHLQELVEPDFKKTAKEMDEIGDRLLSAEDLKERTRSYKIYDEMRNGPDFGPMPHTWADAREAEDNLNRIYAKRTELMAKNPEVLAKLAHLNKITGTKFYTLERLREVGPDWRWKGSFLHTMMADHPQWDRVQAQTGKAMGRGLGLMGVGAAMTLHYYGEEHGIQKREVPAPEAQPQLEQKPEPQSEEVKSSSANLDE